jgi:hypothetical protein
MPGLTFRPELDNFLKFIPAHKPSSVTRTVIAFHKGRTFHSIVAFLLAATYFCFQVEPFEKEYLEQNRAPVNQLAFSTPSLTWETFDKSNAPKAFTVDPCIAIGPLHVVAVADDVLDPFTLPSHPVRDKSPPCGCA